MCCKAITLCVPSVLFVLSLICCLNFPKRLATIDCDAFVITVVYTIFYGAMILALLSWCITDNIIQPLETSSVPPPNMSTPVIDENEMTSQSSTSSSSSTSSTSSSSSTLSQSYYECFKFYRRVLWNCFIMILLSGSILAHVVISFVFVFNQFTGQCGERIFMLDVFLGFYKVLGYISVCAVLIIIIIIICPKQR